MWLWKGAPEHTVGGLRKHIKVILVTKIKEDHSALEIKGIRDQINVSMGLGGA